MPYDFQLLTTLISSSFFFYCSLNIKDSTIINVGTNMSHVSIFMNTAKTYENVGSDILQYLFVIGF